MLRALIFLLIIDTCCSAATVKMSVGWEGTYRVGRWTPVFVTASDPIPRNVILELYVSHDQKDGLRIRQNATITPSPTTFVLYAPIGVSRDDISVTLRDAQTEQRLATTTSRDSFTPTHPLLADAVSQLVVISGSPDSGPILQTQLNDAGFIASRWVDPIRLPSVALGYDAMNLLILNSPDFERLAVDQQEAMLDWIRAGGDVICWFGPENLPNPSPLIGALPATIGSNTALTLAGHNLIARELSPGLNAKKIPLLDGQITAWQRRLGFGTISLLPIDPSGLSFENPDKWLAFWSPLLNGAVNPQSRVAQEQADDRYVDAVIETRQSLGEEDQASHLNFHGIWLMLLVACGVMGPLDWFVLKKLDHRPWTYSTIVGWVGFISLCGVGLVRASIDEPTNLRSIELIDQADGITVGKIRIASKTGPASDPNPQDWCEPFAADKTILQRSSSRVDFSLHEDQHGVHLEPTSAGQPTPKMILSQTIAAGAPIVSADLRLESREGKPMLVGTITNLSQSAMESPSIVTKNGAATFQTIPAGATINIDTALAPPTGSNATILNLTTARTMAMDHLLQNDDHVACLTAKTSQPAYLRALISLK